MRWESLWIDINQLKIKDNWMPFWCVAKNPVHGRGSLKDLVMESDNFNENPIEFQWAPLLKSSPATLGARGTVLDGSNGVAQFKRRTQSSEERM